MIINELVLHNVGTFVGRQALELTPPARGKPIVLVGGLNGAGKTTILESIQLALYGPLYHQSGRRTGSYDNYLRGLIHRNVAVTEGAAVELTFTAYQEGAEHRYWIRRSWKSTGSAIREILLVSVDGRHNQSLTSTWAEHVETFLPRGIAGLFFFDGEQIEALADLDRSRQVLGSALDALLGLDLVDRLSTDLTVLKRRHRGEQIPDHLRQLIEEKGQLVSAHLQAVTAAKSAKVARNDEQERARKALYEATEGYRSAGGELLEQRETAERRADVLDAALTRCEDAIRRELADVTPLLQVGSMMQQLASQAKNEANAKRDGLLVNTFTERDHTILQKLTRGAVDPAILREVETFLEEDRAARRASAAADSIVNFTDAGVLNRLLSRDLPEARRRTLAEIEHRTDLKREADEVARMLAAIPDAEALADLHRAREEARDAYARAEAAHTVATEMLDAATTDQAKAQASLDAVLDKAAHATLAADDDRRLVEHVDRVRATLENLRIAASRRHLERISQLILEALSNLLRKEKLITNVQIDPETHTVALTGVDGRDLPATDLSAGERQLLAVALLWGLARAAGQPLPVVIDTPLGRLDGSHRGHLLDRYFPHASHQVVLLSTDTEIDDIAFRRIEPRVGRSYHLEFDTFANATYVKHGYFWE
ncbi:DNA sulfur modification protein DndD [Pseudonocardia sp. ICBG601]|uniref:DNA sulfur modification protein DndD n=1 Tax=Pseudonocardia sp. ICBG601 TaxID=2846759 RepID=UPI001CF68B22|nr:DNA sulfur modification protein DndD [Pseudonocardia sp. ICBG601]